MADRYKIYEKLGAGGVGAVFRAYDSQLKRWVAVKRLLSANEEAEDKSIAAELRREADTLASLRNPNVVTIFDVGSDAEGLFMVMELLQGEDLADVVARGPLPYDDFKELASQTMEGLLSAHQHHILHRDIKPENIKVERLPGGRMQAKIIDFGLARAGLRARKQTEDQEGSVMGSIFYMAPEQLTRQPVDERTDLYSLGCVFYEALSGKKAFDGETMAQVIDKHINHDLIPLHIIAPHVPQWLDAWCMRLMAQKPEDRPTSAQQAIEEFRAWEKMPQMVPYMPYMGMYPGYAQPMAPPMMYPGTGAVPVPGTGAVPAGTGYFPVMEQPPIAYAEPVLEAQPVTEMAAITTPLAVAPSRPTPRTTGAPLAHSQRVSAVKGPTVPARKAGMDKKKLLMIGAGILVVAVVGVFFLGGGSSGDSGSTIIAAIVDAKPPKVSFQLPQDRIYPPADRNISLFLVGNTATLSNRKGNDGKLARANTGEPILEWHDLAERGEDNILRAVKNDAANGPKLVDWPTSTNGAGPKGGRKVLDFRARNGKPIGLELADPKDQAVFFPFGSQAVLGDPGLSILAVTQAESGKLPMRILGLGNDQEASVLIRVDDKKNFVAEIKHRANSAKIVSKDVNACAACVWALSWHLNGTVDFRAKDADGRGFSGSAQVDAPKAPLIRCSIGRVLTADGKATVPASEQFQGYLGELLVYASALKLDQVQLAESRLREHYIQGGASPVRDRLKTKLPWIEPRNAWKLTTSHKEGDATRAVDGSQSTRWATGQQMKGGEWFQVELPSEMDIAGLALDSQASPQDYARKFTVEVSKDGRTWEPPVVTQDGKSALIEVVFPSPKRAKYVKITQKGSATNYWGFQELVFFKK
ncbi:MAG: protein kinase [Verrucomicrobiaceae bacterium]|nr:protein kinase [Verrucomicrobiaceae bacterium]